ncbi:MAG TPA: SEC-C metal-binding domain-containing protein [Candidatus Sulfotelmatobacter sp.]
MRSHPREKTGRNDPCPCGSAKKYKHCCLAAQPLSEESLWRRQHEVSAELTSELMRFAERHFDEDDLFDAWYDFNLEDFPPPMDAVLDEDTIFMPYFLFQWDPARTSRRRRPGEEGIVTFSFKLSKSGRKHGQLTEMQTHFLEQAATQPLSFYEVTRVNPGDRMALRDILLGGETEVIELTATQSVGEGDILYGQIWNVSGFSVLGCSAPFQIPSRKLADILVLRKKLRKKIAKAQRDLAAADLIRYEDDVREAYLNIRDILHTPPRFTNTDGDPLVFHTLTFQVGSAGVAFDALASLAVGLSKEDLQANAELDDEGAVRNVKFDWIKQGNRKIKSWDNTILGSITISGQSLIAEANSKERAERLAKEIEKRMGILAVHVSTIAQTPEEMLKNAPQRSTQQKDDTEEILRDPEARKKWQQMLQRQVEGWVHTKLPILGGKTPMQAVRDPDGREIVEALLRDWERGGDRRAFPGDIRPDIGAVRRLLNLMPAAS